MFSQDGLTALHLACLNGHVDAAVVLIHANADLNAQDHVQYYNPLFPLKFEVTFLKLMSLNMCYLPIHLSMSCYCPYSSPFSHSFIYSNFP